MINVTERQLDMMMEAMNVTAFYNLLDSIGDQCRFTFAEA